MRLHWRFAEFLLLGAFVVACGGGGGGGGGSGSAVLTDLSLTPVDPATPLGTTLQFLAEAEYSNGIVRDVTDQCAWHSSEPSVAWIDAHGLAHTVARGSTSVGADFGGLSAQSNLRVDPPALVSITIDPRTASVVRGATQAFTALGTFTDGSTLDMTATVAWSSSNTAVATIDATGLARGEQTGSCTIRASSGVFTDTAQITVLPPPLVSIAVTPELPAIPRGLTQQFSATGTYSDLSTQDLSASAAWSSSDTAVATIAAGGLATAIATGETTIEARVGAIHGSTRLTVQPEVLVSIEVQPDGRSVERGASQVFVAIGTFSNSTTQDLSASALWTSSDASVANVIGTGLVATLLPGSSTIGAQIGAVSGAATLHVHLALARTGQTLCYDSFGGAIACAGTGQDGELRHGAPWPAPRFTIGTGVESTCITDELTGLMWLRAPDGATAFSWVDALASAAELASGGHSDWRLPTRRELRSLIHDGWSNTSNWLNGQGFSVASTDYWTCSTLAYLPNNAWNTDMYWGVVDVYDKTGGPRLWAVRTANEQAACRAARTGQISCSDAAGNSVPCSATNQDGDLRSGVAWPTPRFAVGSGALADCITDRLTGLTWQRVNDSVSRTWEQALAYSNGLVLCGHDDWRLPNVLELESLFNAEVVDSSAWLNAQGFIGLGSTYYWTSTSLALDPAQAWVVQLGTGYVWWQAKTTGRRALAVRGP